ncbi:S8 family serine peptidase [Rapidithrix thailandica]|uniref:S8 family serine peptidase n=1 Tax=Rapidithrix thailandica TaxID=413964 RepID=A0AAW9SCF3_9BACT
MKTFSHIIICFCFLISHFTVDAQVTRQQGIVSGKVVVKLKTKREGGKGLRALSIQDIVVEETFQKLGVSHQEPVWKQPNRKKSNYPAQRNTIKPNNPLESIYQLTLENGVKTEEVLNELNQLDWVEYAEPLYLYELLHTPDDPVSFERWELSITKALEAWDISKGDTSVLIGVVDTGVDTDHPDLINQWQYNYAEKYGIEGVDDDGNGYVDDTLGFDFGDWDTDVSDQHGHGTRVAGVASAETDNGIGVSGIGYHSRILPVKAMASGNFFRNTIQAIIYAALQGCDVINLSWGRVGNPSLYEEDVINFITENYDVVFVGAAGNKHAHLDYYPASYENVLSVTHSTSEDKISGWSTYGYKVDLMAPGFYVASTNNGGTYKNNLVGSSYASPHAAGAAALVRAYYPGLKANQVHELLRVTSDDIYGIHDEKYANVLGKGRLNIYRALTEKGQWPAVRLRNINYSGKSGKQPIPKDTIEITSDFINYLEPVSASAKVTLSSLTEGVEVLDGEFAIANLETFQTLSNHDSPFRIALPLDLSSMDKIVLKFDIQDGAYQDFQIFTINVNPGYFLVKFNRLALGIDSDGRLGRTGTYFVPRGGGMFYDTTIVNNNLGLPVLEEMGLILTSGPGVVSDAVYKATDEQNSDFTVLREPILHSYDNTFETYLSEYEDYSSNDNPVGVRIAQKVTGWKNTGHLQYVMVEYDITNVNSHTIDTMYAGLFSSWILADSANHVRYDSALQMGYLYSDSLNWRIGIQMINEDVSFAAFDWGEVDERSKLDLSDGFSDQEKYYALSNGILQDTSVLEKKVGQIIGAPLYNIKPGESRTLALTIAIDTNSLHALKDVVQSSKMQAYLRYTSHDPELVEKTYCSGETIEISPQNGDLFRYYYKEEDAKPFFIGETLIQQPEELKDVYYIANYSEPLESDRFAYPVNLYDEVHAEYSAPDTLYFIDGTGAPVLFTDKSSNAVKWHWDFGDSTISSQQHPEHTYQQTGEYEVILTTTDAKGCQGEYSKNILVIDEAVLGIDEVLSKSLKIYPNPTGNTAFLEWGETNVDIRQIRLLTIEGKELSRVEDIATGNGVELALKGYNTSLILVQVLTDSGVAIRKVIVQ